MAELQVSFARDAWSLASVQLTASARCQRDTISRTESESPALDVYEVEHEADAKGGDENDDHDDDGELERLFAVPRPFAAAGGVLQHKLQ
jgi:hypothetical protein